MYWVVIGDEENTDYDMFDGAIVKADSKEEAEKIALMLNNNGNWTAPTNQTWEAKPLDEFNAEEEQFGKGILFTSFRAG